MNNTMFAKFFEKLIFLTPWFAVVKLRKIKYVDLILIIFLRLTDESSELNLFPTGTTANHFRILTLYSDILIAMICEGDLQVKCCTVRPVTKDMSGNQTHSTH